MGKEGTPEVSDWMRIGQGEGRAHVRRSLRSSSYLHAGSSEEADGRFPDHQRHSLVKKLSGARSLPGENIKAMLHKLSSFH